jgi:hypothetical protein
VIRDPTHRNICNRLAHGKVTRAILDPPAGTVNLITHHHHAQPCDQGCAGVNGKPTLPFSYAKLIIRIRDFSLRPRL